MATYFSKSALSASATSDGIRMSAVCSPGGTLYTSPPEVESRVLKESDEGVRNLWRTDAEDFAKCDLYEIRSFSQRCNLLPDAKGCERITIDENLGRTAIRDSSHFGFDEARDHSSSISGPCNLGFEENGERMLVPLSASVDRYQDNHLDAFLGPPRPPPSSIAEFWAQLREIEALIPPAHSFEDPTEDCGSWARFRDGVAPIPSLPRA